MRCVSEGKILLTKSHTYVTFHFLRLSLYFLLSFRFINYSPDLSQPQQQSAIQRALGVWAQVSPLSFSRKADANGNQFRDQSDIEISFGSGNHGSFHPADGAFDGPSSQGGSVLAHAFNPGSTRFPDLRGDMHFDEDERWQDGGWYTL